MLASEQVEVVAAKMESSPTVWPTIFLSGVSILPSTTSFSLELTELPLEDRKISEVKNSLSAQLSLWLLVLVEALL
jgi:hypothetical protein